jgi:hypothetical protein
MAIALINRLNVDGRSAVGGAQVDPVGDKIGSPRPPVDQGEPQGEP